MLAGNEAAEVPKPTMPKFREEKRRVNDGRWRPYWLRLSAMKKFLRSWGEAHWNLAASFRIFSLLAIERRRHSLSQQSSCKGSACEGGSWLFTLRSLCIGCAIIYQRLWFGDYAERLHVKAQSQRAAFYSVEIYDIHKNGACLYPAQHLLWSASLACTVAFGVSSEEAADVNTSPTSELKPWVRSGCSLPASAINAVQTPETALMQIEITHPQTRSIPLLLWRANN